MRHTRGHNPPKRGFLPNAGSRAARIRTLIVSRSCEKYFAAAQAAGCDCQYALVSPLATEVRPCLLRQRVRLSGNQPALLACSRHLRRYPHRREELTYAHKNSIPATSTLWGSLARALHTSKRPGQHLARKAGEVAQNERDQAGDDELVERKLRARARCLRCGAARPPLRLRTPCFAWQRLLCLARTADAQMLHLMHYHQAPLPKSQRNIFFG